MKLQKHQHPRQRRSNGLISPQLYKIIRIKSNHGHLHLRQHIMSISATASNNACKDDDKKIVNTHRKTSY